MKKIKFKMPAFSLAEAFITLLIVCLITLASIPILTKKKRTLNEFASGKWMCTLNSHNQYVVYSSQDPHGDINNPDTWRTSQGGAGCTFLPPQNAKNFGVTLIGGGGGGKDGVSKRQDYINGNESFTPSEDGEYYLFVSGGGGGGAGGAPQSDFSGGSGGAGAYYLAKVKLYGGYTYTGIVGGGGAKVDSEWNTHSKTAETGGPSSFMKAGSNNYGVTAYGGSGGQNRNCKKKECWGGYPGTGGTLTVSNSFKNNNEITRILAGNGASASPEVPAHVNSPGAANTLPKEYSGLSGDLSYGGGGKGAGGNGLLDDKGAGKSGQNGAVKLWQIIKKGGQGGEAAKLTYYSFPNIKGKLVVTIGKGGEANKDGDKTYAELYNLQGKLERTLFGVGGTAGDELVDVIDDKGNHTGKGTEGQNSLWSNTGGGTVGECVDKGAVTSTETVTKETYELDNDGNKICEIGAYFLGPINTENEDGKMNKCPLNDSTIPKGFCAGCSVTKYSPIGCYYEPVTTAEGTEYSPVGYNANIYQTKVDTLLEGMAYEKLIERFNAFLANSWNKGKSNDLTGYDYKENDYRCLKYKKTTITYDETVIKKTNEPACSVSGSGTYFGAGGGGGSASEHISVFGKGGRGAPGAVIVEW